VRGPTTEEIEKQHNVALMRGIMKSRLVGVSSDTQEAEEVVTGLAAEAEEAKSPAAALGVVTKMANLAMVKLEASLNKIMDHPLAVSFGLPTGRNIVEWTKSFVAVFACDNVANRIGRGQFVVLAFGVMMWFRNEGRTLPYPVTGCGASIKF